MVEDHHLQHRSHPSLFHNFKQFNIKVGTVYHPVIQKELYKILGNGAIETLTGGPGFYSKCVSCCQAYW